MTAFNKDDFIFYGGYLTYHGEYNGQPVYEAGKHTHPTRVGKGKPLVIVRFKYGRKPWKSWVNWMVKNMTVETFAEQAKNPEISSGQILYNAGCRSSRVLGPNMDLFYSKTL